MKWTVVTQETHDPLICRGAEAGLCGRRVSSDQPECVSAGLFIARVTRCRVMCTVDATPSSEDRSER